MQQEANDESISLMGTLLDQIASLQGRQDGMDGRLEAMRYGMEAITDEIDILASQGVVQDYFYTNSKEFNVVKRHCYDKISVSQGETFDFSANLSLLWDASPNKANLNASLLKDDKNVAYAADDKGIATKHWQNNSVSLLYRETVDEDA